MLEICVLHCCMFLLRLMFNWILDLLGMSTKICSSCLDLLILALLWLLADGQSLCFVGVASYERLECFAFVCLLYR